MTNKFFISRHSCLRLFFANFHLWLHLLGCPFHCLPTPSATSRRVASRSPTFLLQQSLFTAGQEAHVHFLLPVLAVTVVQAQAYFSLQGQLVRPISSRYIHDVITARNQCIHLCLAHIHSIAFVIFGFL